MTTSDDLGAFFEALLFIAERPLSSAELAELGGVPRPEAEAALAGLADDLVAGRRGLRLQRMDDAWQLATAPEVGERLAAYAAREEARLTPAALEALAVVAYRQPSVRPWHSTCATSPACLSRFSVTVRRISAPSTSP